MNEFPKGTKPEATRAVDVSVDLDASVAEVWPYLSTSDGLSSWYVDVKLAEEKQGAACSLDFGAGMVVPAFVQAYEVGHKIRIGAPPDVDSPRVEEYRVSPREGGGCTVRIVNWGFGEGAAWDAEYEAVKKGWTEFLGVLKRVVEHFRTFGRPHRIQMLAFGADADAAWGRLGQELDIAALARKALGDDVTLQPSFAGALTGVLDARGPRSAGLFAARPTGGFLFRAGIEVSSFGVMISVGLTSFGDETTRAAEQEPAWRAWFANAFPPPATGAPS